MATNLLTAKAAQVVSRVAASLGLDSDALAREFARDPEGMVFAYPDLQPALAYMPLHPQE